MTTVCDQILTKVVKDMAFAIRVLYRAYASLWGLVGAWVTFLDPHPKGVVGRHKPVEGIPQ